MAFDLRLICLHYFFYILKKLLKKNANCGNIIIDFIYRFNTLLCDG